ncbi:protein AATF [Tetranychus urticae]|uniref:protein AATF n=1 Tax=Tetranychus urticae TaxID=32264 RepID=UPI00077BA7DC|nr:protein AATF [Tetranychus urticae]
MDENDEYIEDESEIEEDDNGSGSDIGDNEEEKNRAQALAVKNQLVVFDMLINCRIKLQKALINLNKLPQHDIFDKFSDAGEDVLGAAKTRAMEEEKKLLETFYNLQHLLKTQESPVENDDVEERLDADHKKLISDINPIMNEWWQKTNYATKSDSKAAEEETEIIKNISHILSDRERLLKKTRMKRSGYTIIGKEESADKEIDEPESGKNQQEVIDSEIFDDDDFYGQLLRQLIESKTSVDSVDPISLSRQWLEVQKLRKKMKRKIDTRASKGRRIRYKVHQPLISFMAPIEDGNYEDSAKDKLFASLFAQRKVQET